MAFDWRGAEDAIRQWLLKSSGYSDQNVIHLNDNGNRPVGDYIAFALGNLIPIGHDELSTITDVNGTPGEETTVTVSGQRESNVQIQAFSGERNADSSARAVLSRVQTQVSLPGIRAMLAAAGVVVFDRGTIDYLPAIRNIGFEGRGILNVRIYCGDSAIEKTTYIERVELVDTDTSNVIHIPEE